MDMLAALVFFVAAMALCILGRISMIPGLLAGYAAFVAVGLRRGRTLRQLMAISLEGVKEGLPVMKIMLIIGVLTATWRMSGTIVYFVYYGVRLITPRIFILAAFLLTCLISYAIGTSFGVSATVGVILMAIARSGGVPPAIAAGAIFSGVYYGDRCSPVSSSANVVAAMTNTDIYGNVGLMHKTGWLPLALSALVYGLLSYFNPIQTIDPKMLSAIEADFAISHLLVIPVVIMLALPLFKIPIARTCLFSIISAGLIAVLAQKMTIPGFLTACLWGYQPQGGMLGDIIRGGGAWSMMEVVVILVISCTYSKIFESTGMLGDISGVFDRLVAKTGRFAATTLFSIASVAIFCNQTIASIVTSTLLRPSYHKSGGSDRELAIDLENSVIVISGLVPWCIACSVPLSFMGADMSALPYAVLLYAIPICHFFTKKRFFPSDKKEAEQARGA